MTKGWVRKLATLLNLGAANRKVGDRIGAILDSDYPDVVRLIGYGTYQGEHVPPVEIGDYNLGRPQPKLVMDDGQIVWGCECTWGTEEKIKELIGASVIEKVNIAWERGHRPI